MTESDFSYAYIFTILKELNFFDVGVGCDAYFLDIVIKNYFIYAKRSVADGTTPVASPLVHLKENNGVKALKVATSRPSSGSAHSCHPNWALKRDLRFCCRNIVVACVAAHF